jgi:hypothetical protein
VAHAVDARAVNIAPNSQARAAIIDSVDANVYELLGLMS